MTYFQILKRLIWDFRNFVGKTKFILIITFWLITTFIAAIEPFFASNAIKILQQYIEDKKLDLNYIFYFFLWWMIFIIINSLVRYFYRFNLVDVSALKFYVEKAKYYKDKILTISQWVYLEKKWASLFKIMDRWTDDILSVIHTLFLDLFISLISVSVITIIILFINIKLSIAVLWVMPIVLYLWYYFNVKTKNEQKQIHKDWEKFFWILWDFVTNLTLVKTLTYEKNIWKTLDELQQKTLSSQISVSKKWGIADIYIQFMVNISRFLVLLVWIYLITKSSLDFATLFLFYAYIAYIYFPVSSIFSNLKNIQKSLESIKKLYEEFDEIELDKDLENAWVLENINWKIEFKDVQFSYLNWKNVLNNINFSINPWEKVALVWSTWSWKSTITNLIFRFWELNSGNIFLDWVDIKTLKKSFIRNNIWIVMQDNSLFNTTIFENMQYAKKDATAEEMTIALKKAKADFVFNSKEWLQTIIWERWLKLSGWEKQRLNIARIFLKNPKILILDEATSALDNKTEIEIQSSLDELLVWKTSIIIAHRLSTIKKVDRIFVLKDWNIVEEGKYDELLEKKWYFYNLANPEKLVIN